MSILQPPPALSTLPTEDDIQMLIYKKSISHPLVLPNYTPPNWFECDVCVVTNAGYVYEYEIKRTVTDFLADAKKKKLIQRNEGGYYERYKHDLLNERHEGGPSRFWYVTPKGLLDDVKLPEYAGLLEVENGQICYKRISAPRLHRMKITAGVQAHMQDVLYHRYWSERQKNNKLRNQLRKAQA